MHTPTPWCTEPGTGTLEIWRVDSSDLIATLDIPSAAEGPTVQANAHFIVTAANSHQALVDALTDALECLSRLPDADGAYRVTCISQARDALRQAGSDA